MRLELVTDEHQILPYYYMLEDIPYADDLKPHQVLANILLGKYLCLLAYREDEVVGLVVYYVVGTMAFVVGLWGRNNLKGFPQMFYDTLKQYGITHVRAQTVLDSPAYGRKMDMVRLWSVYEHKIK